MNLFYLLITGVYATGCWCLGLVLHSLLPGYEKDEAAIEWYALVSSAFLLGQAVFANIWLLMGVAGVFTPALVSSVVLGIFGICCLLLRKKKFHLFVGIRSTMAGLQDLSWYWQALGILIAVVFMMYGVKTVASPPIGDAAAFYMVLPKLMAASHRLVPQPNYYTFSQVGLSGEMQYAALMSVASPQAAKLFTWFTALALAGILVSVNSVVGNSKIGKLASLAMLFTSTAVTYYIFDGKVDIFGGAFGLAAYYWGLRTRNDSGPVPYCLTGLFTGFAIIAKLTSLPVIVPGIIILIVWNNLSMPVSLGERYARTLKWLCLVGLIAFCTMIPHGIKNYMLFGEPFAPLLFLKSGGKLVAEQAYFSYEATKHIIMTYPIALVYGKYPMQDGNISVLLLACAPLFLLMPGRADSITQRSMRQVVVVAAAGVIIWMIVRPSWILPRYIMATLVLFIPSVAQGIEKLFLEKKYSRVLLRSTIFITILTVVCAEVPYSRASFKQFVQHISSSQTGYEATGPAAGGFNSVNSIVRPGERVFFAGYYGYFLSPDLLQCSNGPDEHTDIVLKSGPSAAVDWAYLYDRGFSYLLLDKSTHAGIAAILREGAAPAWLEVIKISDDQSASLYSIRSLDSGKRPSYICRQVRPHAWDVVSMSE